MMKLIWSWKWRLFAISLFAYIFISAYSTGFLNAIYSVVFAYAIYGLGQLVADEIAKVRGEK